MSRNLFISFLGTSSYIKCNYFEENNVHNRIENVKYVQEAIIQLNCKNFQKSDQYCFFLTEKARKINWEDDGHGIEGLVGSDHESAKLKQRLEALNLPGKIVAVDIPEGHSTEELWEIFEKVYSCINDGDQIYFDITHAFRSLPLLGLALLNYAKALKRIEVKGIYYGAFEKLGSVRDVEKMELPERNAPLFNLKSVSELQDWTNAAFEFTHYGKVNNLVKLTRNEIAPILKDTQGKDKAASFLRAFSKDLEKMESSFATNRGNVIQELNYDALKCNLELFSENSFIKPLHGIIEKLKGKVADFRNNDPLVWLKSAKWCLDHGMYQQAITQMQEGVLTWMCLQLSQSSEFFDWKNEKARNLLSSVLAKSHAKIKDKDWKGEAREYLWYTRALHQTPFILELARCFNGLTELRNDVNHGGYRKNSQEAQDVIKKIKELFDKFINIQWPEKLDIKFSLLLNLSNHPVASWQEKQLEEVKKMFCEVMDMPFPSIPPEMSEEDVEKMVDDYFQKIIELNPVAVHVMGEMTFTFRLVQKLKEAGIICLASTTERIVEESEGKKTVEFRFQGFRKY